MKKVLFGMMACAALCACTSDDLLSVADQAIDTTDGSVSYLTVRLKDVNSGTRATSPTDAPFAYGTTEEQTVNNAYFYFYDEDGAYMAKGSLGAVSGTGKTSNENADGNIEWSSNTVVAVYGLEKDGLPTKMLTVLNQPEGVDLSYKSLDEATAVLAGTPWGEEKNLVMSTSVYYDGSYNTIYNYTPLVENNFATEPIDLDGHYGDDGEYTAVEVYVERLAAKVSASVGKLTNAAEDDGDYIDITDYVASEFANGAPEGGVFVKLLGFNVNGVARDAYVVKKIEAWISGAPFNNWQDVTSYRSYWAESPNYGVDVEYPTTSNGNTDADEDGTGEKEQLNEYLKYVSLTKDNLAELDKDAVYCGENTNTTTVLDDATSNGITNLLVKGQVYTKVDESYVPLDLVEFHGMYYTADDFLQKTVDDVVNYDFTVVVDEVLKALEDKYTALATYFEDFNDAIIHDHIYVTTAVEGHKVTNTNFKSSLSSSLAPFDGSMLSLYNLSDGNVDLFFKGAQPYYGASGDGDEVEPTLCAKYKDEDIVYPAKPADLNDYEFYFHIDKEKLSLSTALYELVGVLVEAEVDGEIQYFMPIDNTYSFTTASQDIFNDSKWYGDHEYTLRNYLLRAITVEADGIDAQFDSHYPNLFADGMMYYHTPIEHLATSSDDTIVEGQYGIVRNHWYNVTITSLENFGRGIADEDEVIVPQPDVTYYYLGADVNILSWKMVEQTVGW